MSWFIGFLKHICCFGDEERKDIARNQGHGYHRIPNIGYGIPSVKQSSLAQSSNIHSNQYEHSSRSLPYSDSHDPPSVTTKPILPSISRKSNEYAWQTKGAHLSSSNCSIPQSDVPNRATNKLTGETCFGDEDRKGILGNQRQSDRDYHRVPSIGYGTSSVKQSSLAQSSNIHSKQNENLPRSLRSLPNADSQDPPSVSTMPILPPIPKKSNESAWQPRGAHLSSSNCSVPQFDIFSSLEKDPLPFSPSPSKSHSKKPPPISTKPTLSVAPSSSLSQQEKTNYVWVQKSASSTYVFPKDIKNSIEKEILPGVLKKPLSMSTYKDYFHSLLYAEDYYLQKWDGFEMKNITLKLHEAEIYMRNGKRKNFNEVDEKDKRTFVAFEINKLPARPPFLLSRDHVSVQPSSRKIKAFQGVIYRVVKGNLVLIEFGEDFHSQHHPACEYDVKFSFNRVCLKRAHHAIASASDLLFRNFLFPGIEPTHDQFSSTQHFLNYRDHKDAFAIHQILRLQGSPPYLVEGPMSVVGREHLSKTAAVIVEAVLRICQYSPSNRVLLCAPVNNTCDVLMRALKKGMEESDMFRANAAFREIEGVPEDILPSCQYEEEMDCFACPSLEELKKYKVISSTFMSSFRLRDEGMMAGDFSHIFLVDASSATEPETMVPLANFTNSKTTVVVTGAPGNHSGWVRSQIARQNGLRTSYFERLRQSELYKNLDPRLITQLEDP